MRPARLRFALALALVAAAGSPVRAQSLTAQISGNVLDLTDSAVPGATVTLTNAGTNSIRESKTGDDGAFLFVDLIAGTYDLKVTRDGFNTVLRKGIPVASTERTRVHAIGLAPAGVQDSVVVSTEAPLVQTTTSARSGQITRDNVEDIALKSRDIMALLVLLPGIIDTNPREAPSWTSSSGLSINGRSTGFNFSYDGITNRSTDGGALLAAPALDSIAEVRVQSSNFQAEYGRSSGASITTITRSGSSVFRGSAAFYKRDDSLNGNEYARKVQCRNGLTEVCQPALYEFDNFAWTLGGPVLVPGSTFNRSRNTLFFFWSQDRLARTTPILPLTQQRMPTRLERDGDFSQTRNSDGAMIYIRDPRRSGPCTANAATAGAACFPGNVIPAELIDRTGQAFLNLFPLPNTSDPRNQYNYVFQVVQDYPRDDQVLRVDWKAGPRTTVFGRFGFGYEKRTGSAGTFAFMGGWPQMDGKFESDTISYVTTVLHSLNAVTFMEATAGVNWSYQRASAISQAALDANTRGRVLPGLAQFFKEANPLDLLPNATFNGGVPGTTGFFLYERRFPFYGYNTLWDFSTNLTRIQGAHNLKAGLFVEHATRPVRQRSAFNGTISFNAEGANPLNTNIGFANALLGAITSYQKADVQPSGSAQFVNTEFFVQENWRATRKFTVDAGVRFYVLGPPQNRGGFVGQFEPAAFDPAAAPLLFEPVMTAEGRRAARNPMTGEVVAAAYVGRIVPGSGDVDNGMKRHEGTPHQHPPFEIAPRAGFAWDVTGNGRTAIRGGFGTFYDRYLDTDLLELVEIPPLVRTYTTTPTTFAGLADSPLSEATPTPNAVRRLSAFVPPVVHTWSLGIQRELGWRIVGDFAYVGNAARNQLITRELNNRPYGYAYRTENLDRTNVNNSQPQPLPDDLLRPYQGYASIAQKEFSGYSDYHSLQVAVNRRRSSDGLAFGIAYTYQMVNRTLGAIDPFVPDNRARNYNSAGRRPHALTFHYSWLVPGLPRTSSQLLQAALNDWQLSGMTSMLSGVQGGFTYSYINVNGALTGTGSIGGGPSRPRILCDPELPRSERTFERQFRTECIAPPDDEFRLGTARGDEFHGPGYMNWDISVFKNVGLKGRRRLQFRVELYNAFDAKQWTGVNTNAQFNYQTGALNNPAVFGSLTDATNSARRVQLAVRFTF
jgi:hypothetical protein